MSLDFRNINTLWSSILVETLRRSGLRTAVICPGSRSGPLAVAFAQHEHIEAIPILDERSAAFFALGLALRSGMPTALVCTSGTAGANFYPAVIEAHESRVPLLVLTADRPPELRHCHAGQAIDQVKLYGHYPNWQVELALPRVEPRMLAYLRQTMIQAWRSSIVPIPGPVHVNLPFRDPLAPTPQPEIEALASSLNPEEFFSAVSPEISVTPLPQVCKNVPLARWQRSQRGVIIAGPAQPQHPQTYCEAIVDLSQVLGWPVLAAGLSPLRNFAALNPYLITTYDLLLRNSKWAIELAPELVIRLGPLPTSKVLRVWLEQTQPHQWIIDPADRNFDPLHGKTSHLRCSIQTLVQAVLGDQFASLNQIPLAQDQRSCIGPLNPPILGDFALQDSTELQGITPYLDQWLQLDHQVRQQVHTTLVDLPALFEGKVAWLLSQHLPSETPIFIANSMPVRDVEWFWQPGNTKVKPYFNRGANGIDGTLSSALGMAYRHQSSVLLTGDLALLHDTNGFLIQHHWVGHLTIILINNNGGGIFSMLPIANFDPPFEPYFATPQSVDFGQLCCTYGISHEIIQSWTQLIDTLLPLPTQGIRVLEIGCDRHGDTQWRLQNLGNF